MPFVLPRLSTPEKGRKNARAAPSETPRARDRPTRPRFFAALIFAFAAIAYRDLWLWAPRTGGHSPVVGWFFEASATFPQLAFGVAACLAYRRRQRLGAAMAADGSPWPAALLLVPGLLLFSWGRYLGAVDLVMASLIPTLFGSALLLAGPRLAIVLFLPVGFLIFAIPLPGVLTNQIVYPLQLLTARLVAGVLSLIGVTAVQEGDVVHAASGVFEIIESCSGLRSIEIMTMLAVAYVGFFSMSRLHAALLVAAGPVIGFLLNGARVVALILTPGSDLTRGHTLQGLAMFVGGAVSLYLLDWLLLTLGASRDEVAAARRRPATARPGGGYSEARAFVVAVLFAGMATASLAMPGWSGEEPPGWKMRLPPAIEGWRADELPLDRFFMGSIRLAWFASRRYERDGREVAVLVAYDDRQRPDRSLRSAKNALPERGWEVEEEGTVKLEPGGFEMRAVLARSGGRRVLSYHAYRGVGGFAVELLRSALALDRSPFRRVEPARLLRLATPVDSTPEGRGEAEARLQFFFRRLGAAFLAEQPNDEVGARRAPRGMLPVGKPFPLLG